MNNLFVKDIVSVEAIRSVFHIMFMDFIRQNFIKYFLKVYLFPKEMNKNPPKRERKSSVTLSKLYICKIISKQKKTTLNNLSTIPKQLYTHERNRKNYELSHGIHILYIYFYLHAVKNIFLSQSAHSKGFFKLFFIKQIYILTIALELVSQSLVFPLVTHPFQEIKIFQLFFVKGKLTQYKISPIKN